MWSSLPSWLQLDVSKIVGAVAASIILALLRMLWKAIRAKKDLEETVAELQRELKDREADRHFREEVARVQQATWMESVGRLLGHGGLDSLGTGGSAAFVAALDVSKMLIEFPKGYLDLNLTRDVAEVDDAAVTEALARLAEWREGYAPKAGAAAIGDRVTLTGQRWIAKQGQWQEVPEGTITKSAAVLGAGTLNPAWERALLGTTAGSRVEVVEGGDGRNPVAENAVVCVCAVEGVEKLNGGTFGPETGQPLAFGTAAQLRAAIRRKVEGDVRAGSDIRLTRRMLDEIDAANPFDVPAAFVKVEADGLFAQELGYLRAKGLPVEASEQPLDDLRLDCEREARRRVRLGIVFMKIAIKHDIAVSDDEVLEEMERRTGDPVRKHGLGGSDGRFAVRAYLLESKVRAWILERARIRQRTVTAKDLLAELE
jgi:trigger factor